MNVRASSPEARLASERLESELLLLARRRSLGVGRGASYAVYRSLLPAMEEALDDGRSPEERALLDEVREILLPVGARSFAWYVSSAMTKSGS